MPIKMFKTSSNNSKFNLFLRSTSDAHPQIKKWLRWHCTSCKGGKTWDDKSQSI